MEHCHYLTRYNIMSILRTGNITDISIGKYPGGTDTVRILTVQVTSVDDIQTVEHVTESGVDSAPVVGDKVLVELVGESSYKVSHSTGDLIDPVSLPGEKEFYSHDKDSKKARIKLNLDGSTGIKNEISGLDFATEMTKYNTAVKAIVTTDGASVNGASQTALDVALADLLKIVGAVV